MHVPEHPGNPREMRGFIEFDSIFSPEGSGAFIPWHVIC